MRCATMEGQHVDPHEVQPALLLASYYSRERRRPVGNAVSSRSRALMPHQ
jgi:hypothetical protein